MVQKFIHAVKFLGIRDIDMSNLSLKSNKNMPVLSTMKVFYYAQIY